MTKKNILLAALLSVTALGGVAVAAETIGRKGPMQADTNGDGVVSRSEYFTAAETRFKKQDANGDRKLTGEEMKDRRGRFARQDANNDGALSFDELAARTSARFVALDADKDGKLTPEELGPGRGHGRRGGPGMMQGPDGPGGPMGGMALQRLDTNKDGKISREEMRAQADQRFDRLDANKDGSIDQGEVQSMRGRGPGGRGGPSGDTPPPPPPPAPDDGGE